MRKFLLHLRTVITNLREGNVLRRWAKLGMALATPVLLIAVINLIPGVGEGTQAAFRRAAAIDRPQEVANLPLDFQFMGQGRISGGAGDTWMIGDIPIEVAKHTHIVGELHAGDFVVLSGRILPDKTWLADRIQATQEDRSFFTFNGPLEGVQQSEWQVGGQSLTVNKRTEVEANLQVGQVLLATFSVLEDRSWTATKIVAFNKFPAPPESVAGEALTPISTGGTLGVAAGKVTNIPASAGPVKPTWASISEKEKVKAEGNDKDNPGRGDEESAEKKGRGNKGRGRGKDK